MSRESMTPPNLNDLFARYLQRQADSEAAGIASFDAEVTPYEVGPVQPADPKAAWDETLTVIPMVAPGTNRPRKAPPHWAQLISQQDTALSVACCVGNFPQMMRSFHAIVSEKDLSSLKPRPHAHGPANIDLAAWAQKLIASGDWSDALLAIGALRLTRQFDEAESLIHQRDNDVPAEYRLAWENEKAAIAWYAGRCDEAIALWDGLAPVGPVLFNRGMARLFLNRTAEARQLLAAAAEKLPEGSAWQSLARVYKILAELK